jgi:hypothetical protein
MSQEKPDYAVYLLRLWKSNEPGHAGWRASLESLAEGRRYNFARLEALISFLFERFGPPRPEPSLERRHESPDMTGS